MRTSNKLITTLLLLTFLTSCLNRSKEKNDLAELNLKGKVKSVIERTYFQFSYKEAEGGNKIVIENDNYKSDDINETKTWEFNGDGNIVEKTSKKIKDNKNEIEKRNYDMLGRLKEENVFSDGSSDPYKATYDYPFMSRQFKSRKDLLGESTYKYDDKGKEIEVSNPTFGTTQTQYTYNERGWLTSKTQTASGVVTKTEYELDADGKLMYETLLSADGKEIEKKEYLDGVLSKIIKTEFGGYEHSFNDKEDLIIDISFNDEKHQKQSSKQVYQYEYDENGNWTKRIKSDHLGWKKVPSELTIREIKY